MESSASITRIPIGTLPEQVGQVITIAGWVTTKRDHGKVIFLDIKDASGKIQTVSTSDQSFFKHIQEVREHSTVVIQGTVVERPEKLRTQEQNGRIELQVSGIAITSLAKELPWGGQESHEVNEELRMRYRYLDLRSEQMQRNMYLRSSVMHFIRNYLNNLAFVEIETPYITKGTPEGAREYIIPSRLNAGHFYALPQSPQQFKQLLMVGGFDRYFQIARCFRDEDPRGDRQPEFTQLDIEMSFVTQEDIFALLEPMMIELIKTVSPEKKITQVPFPRIPYAEAMEKYQSDKPDLRSNKNDPNEIALCWIVDIPLFERSESEKKLVATHHLFTRPRPGDEHLLDSAPEKAISASYDLVANGYEIGGGSIRIHEPELQKKVFRILGISDEEAQARFGHMLEAFSYGVPPHGGIAPGLDRIVMILAGEPNIREVIAFPKTGDGRDLMMGAPAPISDAQLKEVHISSIQPPAPLHDATTQ